MKLRQSDTTRIIIATTDLVMAQEIMSKSKERWGNVPIQFDVYSDQELIIHQVRSQKYSIVLLHDSIPGVTRNEFSSKISQMSANIQVQDLDRIENWNEFFEKTTQNLPDDLISRYQLGKRDTELYMQLSKFAFDKYGKTDLGLTKNWIGSLPGFVLVAASRQEDQALSLQHVNVHSTLPVEQGNPLQETSWRRPSWKAMKFELSFSICIVAIAACAAILSERFATLQAIEPLLWIGVTVTILGLCVNWTLRGFAR